MWPTFRDQDSTHVWWFERIVVTDKLPIGKVTDLTYEQTVNSRMLGYGTLIVESAGQIQAFQAQQAWDAASHVMATSVRRTVGR